MLEQMSPETEVKIKAALASGDLQTLTTLFAQYQVDPKHLYVASSGIRGNAFHYFSYETSGFQHTPPYYSDDVPDLKVPLAKTRELIQFLLAKGVALTGKEAEDKFFHQWPLSTAIGFDNTHAALAMIEVMKEKGLVDALNPMIKGTFSSSPLLLAIQKSNKQVFYALLNTDMMDVNLADEHGLTALHWAVIMGLPDVAEALVQAGANPEAKAKNGRRPQDYLTITEDDFKGVYKEIELNGQKIKIAQANSTKLPEFRPIVAHFNNDTDAFLKMRAEKLQFGKAKLLSVLNNPRELKKDKEQGKLEALLFQSGDLELAMTLSRNLAAQKEALKKQVEKEKDALQYDKQAQDPDIDKLIGSIGGILQHIKLSDKEEKVIDAINNEDEKNELRISLLADKISEEYGYPTAIAKLLIERIIAGDEVNDKDRMEINEMHQENKKTKLTK